MELKAQKGLTVLSLFDGISGGRAALDRLGIQINTYYASEIEQSAIKIAKHNYPSIVEIGDVSKIEYKDGKLVTEKGKFYAPKIDLILGGSPCTDFSTIGLCRGMITETEEITSLEKYISLKQEGVQFKGQSYLFWEYARLLKEIKPTYFLLENVVMHKKWLDLFNSTLGCEPILLNSSLVSAQNRKRYYWTNIPFNGVTEKHITFDDILDDSADTKDISYSKTVQKGMGRLQQKYGYLPERFNSYNASIITDKAPALTKGNLLSSSCGVQMFVPVTNGVHTVKNGVLDKKYNVNLTDGKYNLRAMSLLEVERLQTLTDGYTKVEGISDAQRLNGIGNGWTIDIICELLRGLL